MKAILAFSVGMIPTYFMIESGSVVLGVIGLFIPFLAMYLADKGLGGGDNSWLDNDFGDW